MRCSKNSMELKKYNIICGTQYGQMAVMKAVTAIQDIYAPCQAAFVLLASCETRFRNCAVSLIFFGCLHCLLLRRPHSSLARRCHSTCDWLVRCQIVVFGGISHSLFVFSRARNFAAGCVLVQDSFRHSIHAEPDPTQPYFHVHS